VTFYPRRLLSIRNGAVRKPPAVGNEGMPNCGNRSVFNSVLWRPLARLGNPGTTAVVAPFRDVMAIPANDHREIAGLITNATLTTFGQTTSFHAAICGGLFRTETGSGDGKSTEVRRCGMNLQTKGRHRIAVRMRCQLRVDIFRSSPDRQIVPL
jgi:hypothetical protein